MHCHWRTPTYRRHPICACHSTAIQSRPTSATAAANFDMAFRFPIKDPSDRLFARSNNLTQSKLMKSIKSDYQYQITKILGDDLEVTAKTDTSWWVVQLFFDKQIQRIDLLTIVGAYECPNAIRSIKTLINAAVISKIITPLGKRSDKDWSSTASWYRVMLVIWVSCWTPFDPCRPSLG